MPGGPVVTFGHPASSVTRMDYYRRVRAPSVGARLGPLDQKWVVAAHGSLLGAIVQPQVGALLGPLAVICTKGLRSRGVENEATEALNFGITFSLAMFLSRIAGELIGASYWPGGLTTPEVLVFVPGIAMAWWGIRRARRDVRVRYPVVWRLVRHPAGAKLDVPTTPVVIDLTQDRDTGPIVVDTEGEVVVDLATTGRERSA